MQGEAAYRVADCDFWDSLTTLPQPDPVPPAEADAVTHPALAVGLGLLGGAVVSVLGLFGLRKWSQAVVQSQREVYSAM